jgi:hypothetical protein
MGRKGVIKVNTTDAPFCGRLCVKWPDNDDYGDEDTAPARGGQPGFRGDGGSKF